MDDLGVMPTDEQQAKSTHPQWQQKHTHSDGQTVGQEPHPIGGRTIIDFEAPALVVPAISS
jgi:hypothetical protein